MNEITLRENPSTVLRKEEVMVQMNMKKWTIRGSVLFLLWILLTACGNDDAAATVMRLRKTEGTVRVSDNKNEDLELLEDMGLYSGYQVGTQSESYAWIDLDSVKLTKMDQETLAEIQKEGQKLEIIIKSGSLFFNITEPLGDDETMDIRTSTMAVGIRGTCGWVEVPDGGIMRVYLLEGRVECTAGGEKKTVSAGEKAVMTESGDITVEPFSARDIPDYIREELEEDDDLAEAILANSGMDVKAPLHSPEEEMAIEQFRGIISGADSYADFFYLDIYGIEYTGEYQYALVQVHAEDTAPTLLLRAIGQPDSQKIINEIINDRVLMFRYDPNSQTAVPIDNIEGYFIYGLIPIQTSEGEDHIEYNDLLLGPDGVGLYFLTKQDFYINIEDWMGHIQIGVLGDRTVQVDEYQNAEKYIPAETQDLQPITWYSTQDASGLDNWLSAAD